MRNDIDDSLIAAVPDLVAFIDRNGVILKCVGGRDIEALQADEAIQGKRLADLWSADAADLLLRLIRRVLKECTAIDGTFTDRQRNHDVRVSPHGRDRVLCVIRSSETVSEPGSRHVDDDRRQSETAEEPPTLERRAFAQRLRHSIAAAALRERPLALCMVHLEGLQDIAQVIDFSITDRIVKTLLERSVAALATEPSIGWYIGQLGESQLTAVIETPTERAALEDVIATLCAVLRKPVSIGDASFEIEPCAGVALLGSDAREPRGLLEHARAAMFESRRGGGRAVRFYSDTLRLRPLTRLDLERELRIAVTDDQLAIRYAARRDLATGKLTALQSYLQWPHPLRGMLRPSEFLPLAENTGLATDLSRWMLTRLQRELPALATESGGPLRVSFGALRNHIVSGALLADLQAWLAQWPPGTIQLELRIAERTLAAMPAPEQVLPQLVELGATILIDEFGRHFSSLTRLVTLPISALQIDRQFVLGSAHDPAALKLCRGVIAIARELEIPCFAAGVDSAEDRERLQDIGIREGVGDCFGDIAPMPAPAERSAAAKTVANAATRRLGPASSRA